MYVSIIIPVLNEEKTVYGLLQQLQNYRRQGHEVIVVDGGSIDKTVPISESLADKVIQSKSGRAIQMNSGATQARFDVLWFLHADTLIPDNAIERIQFYLSNEKYQWGRFNIKLSGSHVFFRVIEKMINIRSCLSSIATGDQGIFITKIFFEVEKGFSDLPLMEDVELCKRLKCISSPVCAKEVLTTSSRRWEKNGILSTVILMWRLRFLYWIGTSADKLSEQYR